jgi:hypothetical protein
MMTTATQAQPARTASLIWLTDRTRFKLGTSRCARARYLGYHAGPTGYGLTARRDSLPLATGLAAHQGLEGFARLLQQTDRLPDLATTRGVIAEACQAYVSRVEARGYRGILGGPQTEETIAEQRALISGLLWALRLQTLPWLHQRYRVELVEQERLHFLRCTCGAPPLDVDEHLRRGCTGTALMIRTDLLARARGGSSFAYFECKTTGWESDAWAEQWETDPQLALGTVDIDGLYGAEVTELYILGLSKGSRRKDPYEEGGDGRKKQMSALCYGYRRPGNPPLQPEDWLPAYQWTTDEGDVKRASRAHRRTGVWELAESDWPVWRAYQANDPTLTPEEFWVRLLPASLLERACFTLGPMNRQDQQLGATLRGMAGEEARWQETLWRLYELQQGGLTWASAAFQSELDRLVPCSWACRPFGKEHQCEFVPVCHRHQGWDDPIGSGQYQPRLPHHTPELEQAVARGLLPDGAEEARDEEDER